jgi:hypothetical protein
MTLFMITTACAIASYGFLGGRLSREVEDAFQRFDPEASACLDVLPEEMQILGQSRGEQGHCPVCGELLYGPDATVFCELCGTGHHPECWSYAGRCSVFGCQGENVRSNFSPNSPGDFPS